MRSHSKRIRRALVGYGARGNAVTRAHKGFRGQRNPCNPSNPRSLIAHRSRQAPTAPIDPQLEIEGLLGVTVLKAIQGAGFSVTPLGLREGLQAGLRLTGAGLSLGLSTLVGLFDAASRWWAAWAWRGTRIGLSTAKKGASPRSRSLKRTSARACGAGAGGLVCR